jgi:RNA polymerase sigma-70 factor (ECF subfamily)
MSESPATRCSLLVRLRDVSDARAWAEFVDVYAPLVYRLARRQGLQDADAADLTQEVLGVTVDALPRFIYDPRRGSFRSWLFTVARHRLQRLFENRRRQPQGSGDPAAEKLLEAQPAPGEAAEWERDYQRRLFEYAAQRVRGHFRPSTWDAFWRTATLGEEARTVAASLGISVGAVYIARNRVLTRIRRQIQRLEGN